MKLQHLKYFLAIAEEQHFGRAAAKLGIRQPPLSLQIKRLESDLGSRLFTRRARGVELTEAGNLLLARARFISSYIEDTERDIRQLAKGETGTLEIGFAGGTYLHPLVTDIVQSFRQNFSGIKLHSALGNTPELMNKLLQGRVDAAFIRAPADEMDEIVFSEMVQEELVAVLPASHRLAKIDSPLRLQELASDDFVICERSIGTGLHDAIISSCQQAGFIPRTEQNAPQVAALVPMVGAGFGVSLVPQSLQQFQVKNVVFRQLKDIKPYVVTGLATRRYDPSPALKNLLNTAGMIKQRYEELSPENTSSAV